MTRSRISLARDCTFFVALLATAIALGAALAHALELPNKIDMPRDEYFIAQSIYRGWNQLGYVLVVELISMVGVVILYRKERRVMWPTLVAIGCLIAAQLVFWTLTFPTNVATSNWSVQPSNWEVLRQHDGPEAGPLAPADLCVVPSEQRRSTPAASFNLLRKLMGR